MEGIIEYMMYRHHRGKGLFAELKTTTLAAVTAAAMLIGSGQAWALDIEERQENFLVGPCTFTKRAFQNPVGSGNIAAYIRVDFNGPVLNPASSANLPTTLGTTITVSDLQNCGFVDAANLVLDGIQGTYQSDDYYGITFRATDPADGVLKNWEVAWSGVSGTRFINTAVPADITSPTVTLSGGPAFLTGTDPFTVSATFDESVTGFDDLANDVTVTNGTVTAITGGPSAYTLTVIPTNAGNVEIAVPAAAAQDGENNDNTASNVLIIGGQVVETTQVAIAGFMLGRANSLASNQPGLTRFLMGEGCGAFSANAIEEAGSINSCVSQGNGWADIRSSWSGDGSYTLGTLGAHGFVNPNLLIGGMVHFDYADDPTNNASGHGWMVGPYFVAKLLEQPLYFEGRLLYGQTDNDITPFGIYSDSFETERWLVQLRATGEYQAQNTTLMPLLDFTYTEDSQQAYTDSLGNTIPGQTVSLMQLSAGLDFSQLLPVSTGTLELTGGLSGVYSSTDGASASPEFENWRGRTHLGLTYDTDARATMNVGAFYDGIATDFHSYGANVGFDWEF